MANLDNYLILVFIVVIGILIAIQFAGERLTDLTEQFFSKSLDKHEEKRKAEKEEK